MHGVPFRGGVARTNITWEGGACKGVALDVGAAAQLVEEGANGTGFVGVRQRVPAEFDVVDALGVTLVHISTRTREASPPGTAGDKAVERLGAMEGLTRVRGGGPLRLAVASALKECTTGIGRAFYIISIKMALMELMMSPLSPDSIE